MVSPFHSVLKQMPNDQHIVVNFSVKQGKTCWVYVRNDFGLSAPASLLPLEAQAAGFEFFRNVVAFERPIDIEFQVGGRRIELNVEPGQR